MTATDDDIKALEDKVAHAVARQYGRYTLRKGERLELIEIPHPDVLALIARLRAAEAERDEAQGALVEMVHAAHGFAEAVRHHAGKAYPWPALDIAKDRARPIVLSRIQKEASDEG